MLWQSITILPQQIECEFHYNTIQTFYIKYTRNHLSVGMLFLTLAFDQ